MGEDLELINKGDIWGISEVVFSSSENFVHKDDIYEM
jgi:hypothetical protein